MRSMDWLFRRRKVGSSSTEQNHFTLGPWGGDGGYKWDDGHSFSGVREITVEHSEDSNVILSITVDYDMQGGHFKTTRHGGINPDFKGTTSKIKLNYPNEYLKGVSGHYSPMHPGGNPYIRSLTFKTNRNRSFGPYGREEGTPFEFTNDTLEIVGFHGRCGWFVDSIGIHLRHRKTSHKKTKDPLPLAPKELEIKKDSALRKYGRDLIELAKAGKLDPVIGRENEIERCIQILSRRTKNNPVLIGWPGVGKTAICEGLAQRIVEGDVPQVLMNRRLISLDVGALVAGTEYRGTFEERLKSTLKEVTQSDGQIMLFIDEIHIVVGAGATSKGAMDAANILKPMLSGGELQCIGATTLDEYRKYIEKDAALERRFQQVYVDPPTVKDTIVMLEGLREKYELHHGVRISNHALQEAAIMSDRYIPGRFLPDKAIDLVDEAAAKLKMEMTSKPADLDKIDKEILKKEMEKLSLENDKNGSDSTERLVVLDREIFDLKLRQETLTNQWNDEKSAMKQMHTIQKLIDDMNLRIQEAERRYHLADAAELKRTRQSLQQDLENLELRTRDRSSSLLRQEVTGDDIAEIVSNWTGIPVSKLKQPDDYRFVLEAESELHKRVVGQDHAVKAVACAIQRSRAGLADPRRPIASFVFLGPTGVGKTELAKAVASFLFHREDALVRIDMSEYTERHSFSRLIGAPPGYVGHDEQAGQLTEPVRRRPYSVVLLDEIEKAHINALNVLLSILDDGRVTDSSNRAVNFANTVIIMTSNVGSEKILEADAVGLGYKEVKKQVLEEVARSSNFSPEFINRVDECIVFRTLNGPQITQVVKLELNQVQQRIESNTKIKIKVTDDAIEDLARWGYETKYGARPVKRAIQQNIVDKLAPLILNGGFKDGDTVSIDRDPTSSSLMSPKLSFRKLP